VSRILRSRLLWELYTGYAVVILLTAFMIGRFVVGDFERGFVERTQESLHSDAILLRDIALPSIDATDPSFQDRIRALGSRTDTRYTVIAADGTVLADSRENPAAMDNHRDRPEIMSAATNGFGVSTRFSRTLGSTSMYVAIPVIKDGREAGFVRTSMTLDILEARRNATRSSVALGLILPVLAALLLGFLIARGFSRPMLTMTDAARAVASGDYGHRVRIARKDEIGDLADALNAMTERLKSQIETITADRNVTLAILASMVEGVVAVDREDYVVHVNSAAEVILGIDAKVAKGRRIWEVTRVVEVGEALNDAMKENRVRVSETRIPKGSSDQVIQLIGAPLKNAGDELVGAVLVLHDVSNLRALEAVRQDFVANISHELKTPLAAIRGLVETLVDDRDMDSDTRTRFTTKIRDQSMRLSNIVSDLLTLSRLESDPGRLQFEAIDLREAVAESYRAQAHVAEDKHVAIKAAVANDPILIDGDGEALRELVDNLVSNAIKYTPEGGHVDVRLGVEGAHAVLTVDDTGIGIAPEDQGRVFERFYRVDKARSRQMGGTGLGLSIVKHVALAHGGNVSLKSAPGRGSSFRVQIPLRRGGPGPNGS
jgi:two-component system, OmpR family, phosphate regulon sensor histidine kinase PhoR